MAGELRKVPAGWQHPKDSDGQHISLHDGFQRDLARWQKEMERWKMGFREEIRRDGRRYWKRRRPGESRMDFVGQRPQKRDYMLPNCPNSQRTHWQLYQTISEGTPITPAFPTVKALAYWVYDAEHGVSVPEHRIAGDDEFWNEWQRRNARLDSMGYKRAVHSSYEDALASFKGWARHASRRYRG